MGKRYDNFTAYYNTFYNARKQYNAGIEALERASEENIDRNRYLQVFVQPDRVANQQNFDDAIIKSADVLRENPSSKWVDDALILIGKSYYYLQNYVGAEQKFQEVIDLGGALEDEARFWLARTLIASNTLTRAADHIEVSLNREGLSSRWESMLRLALGELYVHEKAWGEAAAELERGLKGIKDREIAGRAQFLLGQIYETLEQYENANQAYAKVLRHKPDYPLSYAAQISQVRVAGFHGDGDKALRMLRGMERDDKNFDNRAELMYLRGRIYQAMGDPDRAFNTYDELLFSDDRTLNASTVRGHVHYALGELYRDFDSDFVYAAAHFDTARTALGAITRAADNNAAQEQFAPEAIIDSERQAEVFGTYAEVYDRIVHLDSLIWLGTMEDEDFDEFILDLRRERAKEMAEQQKEVERRQAEQQFQNINNAAQQGPRKQIDGPDALGNSDQGFLFHKDQIQVQEGRITFIALWGERPRVPNWRRQEAVQNAITGEESSEDGIAEVDQAQSEQLADDLLPVVDFSDVPRDEERMLEVQGTRALVRYELANVLFLSMEKPDSAAVWYRMVIDETGGLPVAQRAYYALAEVQQALGDEQSARRLYEDVLQNHPDSDFANQVRERMGMAPVEVQEADSLTLAEEAYEKAYTLWKEKQYEQAVTDMVLLASNYPVPDMVPRALLATGAIYLEWAAEDHLDVHALPMPSVPDSLLIHQGLVDTTMHATPAEKQPPQQVAGGEEAALIQLDSIDTANPLLARLLATRSRADSIRHSADELLQQADSLYKLSDQFFGRSDTLQLASDSLYMVTEALQLESDSLYLVADALDAEAAALASELKLSEAALDSTMSQPAVPTALEAPTEELETAPDETAEAPIGSKRLKLEQLLTAIKERYPQTPHAEHADLMLRAIVELRPGVDSTVVEVIEEEDMQKVLDAMSDEERYLRGPDPIDTTGEGWTLVVGSFENPESAEALSAEYREKGYKSAVIEGATRFRVGVGHFPGLEEARSGLKMFKEEFPPTTWFLDIQKPR